MPEQDVVLTSFTLWSIGCSHSLLTSQWLSKKVRMSAVATSAPRTRERISPTRRKGQQRRRKVGKGNIWASFRTNTLCDHCRGRAGDSPISHLHQKQRAALEQGMPWEQSDEPSWHTMNDLSSHFCPWHRTSNLAPCSSNTPHRHLAAACSLALPLSTLLPPSPTPHGQILLSAFCLPYCLSALFPIVLYSAL